MQVLVDRAEEVLGGLPGLIRADQHGEILCHLALFDRLDAHALQGLGKGGDVRSAIELAAMLKATGPGEDGGNRIRRGGLALLVLAVVTGHGPVGCFGLDRPAVRSHENRGHQAK